MYVLVLSVLIIVLALLAMLFNVKVKLTPDGLAVCFYMTSHARVPVTWQKGGVKLFARARCNGCVRK